MPTVCTTFPVLGYTGDALHGPQLLAANIERNFHFLIYAKIFANKVHKKLLKHFASFLSEYGEEINAKT